MEYVTKCDEGVTKSKSSSHPKVAIFQLVNPKMWRTPTFLKKLFFGKMNGTSSLFLVFPHLVLLNSTQADGHRTEAHPNDVFRSAVSLIHPYTILLIKIKGERRKFSPFFFVPSIFICNFAESKRYLGIIAQASLASSALDLHLLCSGYIRITIWNYRTA